MLQNVSGYDRILHNYCSGGGKTVAKDVFLSYKSEDFAQADWIKGVLEHNGISCWMAPACIPGGSNYASEIPKAIRECRVFVLVLSKKAQESKWVPKEVDQAINEGKTIMPFMLENFELRDDFNFYLSNIQRYAAYENKALAAEKMLREIRAMLNINAEPEPVRQPPVQDKPADRAKPVQSKSVASLFVFGIVSIVFAVICLFTSYMPVSILFAVIGLGLAILWANKAPANETKSKGLALAALIVNLIFLPAVMLVSFFGIGFVSGVVIDAVAIFMFVRGRKKNK